MILALRTLTTATPAFSVAGTALEILAWLAFLGLGIALTVTDVRHRRLPNPLVLALTGCGGVFFAAAALIEHHLDAFWRSLAGLGVSFALYLILGLLARGGLGAGDIKLAAPVGLYLGWLGWEPLFLGIFLAFLTGGLVGIAQALRRRRLRGLTVPFGPFMLLGVALTAAIMSI